MPRLHQLLIALTLFLLVPSAARAQVTAAFSADSIVGCDQLEVNFVDISTGPVSSWSWIIYNSSGAPVGFSPLANPSFIFDIPDTYDVELTVCGSSGCNTLLIPAYITLYESPDADYTASTYAGCPPLSVSFTDNTTFSSGSFVSRFWIVEGGPLLPTTPTISYTFNAPGWYDVVLVVEDDNGCSAFYKDSIEIYAPPVINMTATDYSACNPPFTTTFNPGLTGTPPYTYAWDFGDGGTAATASPSHTYSATGSYDVTLTVVDGNGCQTTIVEPAFIEVLPANVTFAPIPVTGCVGEPVLFSNSSTPSSGTWVWDFGDGSPTSPFFSPSHTYTASGSYTVTLNGSFGSGCSGTATLPLLVSNLPTGDFTSADPNDCQAPSAIGFTSLPGPGVTGYLWDFGDGGSSALANPTHTYTVLGDYTVTLTLINAAGCETVITKPDFVKIRPLDAGFELDVDEGCAPLSVVFSDTTSAPSPIVSWAWTFGTGATASVASPTYTYPAAGCYDVTLTVTSSAGCTGTQTIVDAVCAGSTGTANFTVPDTSCPAVDVGVLTPGLDEVDVLVDGGFLTTIDAPGSSMIIPSVPSGLHTLTLIAYDNGCPDTFSTNIVILEPVDSFVTVIQDCATPYSVTLIINPAVADSSCGWTWDMGDGTILSNIDTVQYTYATTGFYAINLDVACYDLGSCGSLSAGGLYVVDLSVDFTPNKDFICSYPGPIIFNNLSTDLLDDDLVYAWTFGDGGTSFVRSPTRNYTTPGERIITLTVTDINGCTGYHEDTVYIAEVIPGLDWTAPCSPLDVDFTDTASSVAPIASWTLVYGDGTTDVFAAPGSPGSWTHTYPAEGTFPVTYIVEDVFGCLDSINLTVENSFRQAAFTLSDATPCVGDTVSFTNLSIGTGLTYRWDFGVPGTADTSVLFEPTWVYGTLGTYSPSLVVTDVYGCQDSIRLIDFITADTMVVEPFTWTPVVESCNFALVEFRPNPADTTEACEYLWIFGDGGVSTERTPIYPYTLAGEYTVTLIITNCNGCSDSRTIDNAINVIGPFGAFDLSDDSICAGAEVTFIANAARTDSIYLFTGNGDVIRIDVPLDDTLAPFTLTYTYPLPGVYWPQVVLVDSQDCITILTSDSIYVGTPLTADYTLPFDEACAGFPFSFIDVTSSVDPWDVVWVFNDSTLLGSSGDTSFYVPPGPGVYGFSLVVETAFGCQDTVPGSFEVLALPDIGINGDTAVCPGAPVQLLATGGISYAWSPPTGLSDPFVADPFASPLVPTVYSVVVDNGDCLDSAQVTVNTVDALLLDAGTDTTICLGQQANLFASFVPDLPGNLTFSWTPPAGLNDPLLATPSASPLFSTIYTIDASCGNLTESATVAVTVVDPPLANATPTDTLIFPGEIVPLNASSLTGGLGLSYTWTPPIGLSCLDCPDPLAGPFGDTEYRVVITNSNGCTDSAYVRINLRASCSAQLFEVPNIITPNGDGANDLFTFRYEGINGISAVRIFDRWGGLVFEAVNAEDAWDGTRNGQPLEQGVYVYTIEAVCENRQRTIISGNITLIR